MLSQHEHLSLIPQHQGGNARCRGIHLKASTLDLDHFKAWRGSNDLEQKATPMLSGSHRGEGKAETSDLEERRDLR